MEDPIHALEGPRFHVAHVVSALVLLAMLLATGWVYFQRYRLDTALATTQQEVQSAEAQLVELQSQKLDAILVAQKTLDELEKNSIFWSKVITHLGSITPPNVFYRSYTASADGRMSLSVLTDSYDSAANLISILTQDAAYSDVFVSSLTQGNSQSNTPIITFGITFTVLR